MNKRFLIVGFALWMGGAFGDVGGGARAQVQGFLDQANAQLNAIGGGILRNIYVKVALSRLRFIGTDGLLYSLVIGPVGLFVPMVLSRLGFLGGRGRRRSRRRRNGGRRRRRR